MAEQSGHRREVVQRPARRGRAPTNANVWSNYNEYDAEAGFLAGFSANFIAALLTTTHTVGKATVDGGGTESCADKIFLATCTEVGLSGDVTAEASWPCSATTVPALPTPRRKP